MIRKPGAPGGQLPNCLSLRWGLRCAHFASQTRAHCVGWHAHTGQTKYTPAQAMFGHALPRFSLGGSGESGALPRFALGSANDGSAAYDDLATSGSNSDNLVVEASQRPASAPNEDPSTAYRIQVRLGWFEQATLSQSWETNQVLWCPFATRCVNRRA